MRDRARTLKTFTTAISLMVPSISLGGGVQSTKPRKDNLPHEDSTEPKLTDEKVVSDAKADPYMVDRKVDGYRLSNILDGSLHQLKAS